MIGFITRLFRNDTPVRAARVRNVSLGLEALESREIPSGLHLSQIAKGIASAIKHQQQQLSQQIHSQYPTTTLASALSLTAVHAQPHR